jgi:hypothetical protein
MQEGVRFLSKMAGAYASWFQGEDCLFQIGKMAFYPAFALLPKPWLQMEIGPKITNRFLKDDSNPKCLSSIRNREIEVMPEGEEWISLPSKKIGSFFAIVPPCMRQNPSQILTKCHAGLKMRGKITIGIIPRNSPWSKFFGKKMEGGPPADERIRFYSLEEMEHLLTEAGFTIQGLFSTLFQRPGQIITPEIPLKGYHPQAGFFVLIGEKPG